MRCPACTHALSPLEASGIGVDVCDGGCGGIWFDALELRRLGQRAEAAGALTSVRIDPATSVDTSRRRSCPRCDEVVMMRRPHGPDSEVQVDECPGCGGFWLDAGELALISDDLARSAEERAQARERAAAALPEQVEELRRERVREDIERVQTVQAVVKIGLGLVFRGLGRGLLP